MPDATPGRPDWGTTFRQVADGWLFSDVDGKLPETVILPLENADLYDPSLWDGKVDIEQCHRSITFARHGGVGFGILSPKLGAPAAAMAIEAAADRGVRTLIGLGFCGAIAPDLRCGDLLVPTGAVAGDGVSAAYCPERYPAVADRALVAALHESAAHAAPPADAAPDDRLVLHDGLVHSIDAVFLQDSALIERCRALRVAGLDMETSAVLTVARICGIRAATILVASDHPGLGIPTDGPRLSEGARRAMDVALRVVSGDHPELD